MKNPILSILIPTRHRADSLDRCLSELAKQYSDLADLPIEIIVSEDSESSESEKITLKYANTCWINGPCRGPAANRNHATSLARGEWFLFLDDDVIPQPGFLEAFSSALRKNEVEVLEGRIICTDERNSPFYRMAENQTGGNLFTANLAVNRETFEELGGFDEELVIMEDLEFAHRLKNADKRIAFVPNAIVDHPAQNFGLGYLWRWIFHFRWGVLLRYKTGEANPKRNLLLAMTGTVRNHLLLMIRKNVHLVTQHNQKSWANAWFWQIWGWFTLPLALPYLCYWEIRYMREFRTLPA